MAGRLTFGQKLLAGGIVGGLGLKVLLFHKYRKWKAGSGSEIPDAKLVLTDRRVFSRLPRPKQREVLYRKRSQVRDLENITYNGYAPLGGAPRRRRRSIWGG